MSEAENIKLLYREINFLPVSTSTKNLATTIPSSAVFQVAFLFASIIHCLYLIHHKLLVCTSQVISKLIIKIYFQVTRIPLAIYSFSNKDLCLFHFHIIHPWKKTLTELHKGVLITYFRELPILATMPTRKAKLLLCWGFRFWSWVVLSHFFLVHTSQTKFRFCSYKKN